MKTFIFASMSMLLALTISDVRAQTPTGDWMGGFTMPVVAEPRIPERSVSVADFGAKPDGRTLCTEAIAKAIDALAAQGGGRVVFPRGFWLTARINLKSHIALQLEPGALVQFTTDFPLYRQGGHGQIYGENLEDVAIIGQGIIDGNGAAWRPMKRSKVPESEWKKMVASGGRVEQKSQTWHPRANGDTWRLHLVYLSGCKRVLLEGVTFRNSPSWNVHPLRCEDVTVRGVSIINAWNAQNGDGLDIESCRNVIVRDTLLSVGDDGFCLKSGSGEEARRDPHPTENVLIENCTVFRAHGGFVIGSEMSGGVRNVRVNNCTFVDTDMGLRFKTQRGRGGVVEGIYISNINMTNIVTDAIGFNMFYNGKVPAIGKNAQAPKADEGTPQFRDIFVQDVICRGAKRAVQLQGLPEMPLRGVHLRNVSITAAQGVVLEDAENITLQNVEIFTAKGNKPLEMIRSKDVRTEGFAGKAAE